MLKPLKSRRRAGAARGVALIEVLVSVLLLAVGILGVIGLQGTLVQASTDDRMRAAATLMAGEVVASLWTGTAGVDPKSFSGPLPSVHPSATRIMNSLPQGTATVACAATSACTVAISWQMPNATTARTVTQTAVIMTANEELTP